MVAERRSDVQTFNSWNCRVEVVQTIALTNLHLHPSPSSSDPSIMPIAIDDSDVQDSELTIGQSSSDSINFPALTEFKVPDIPPAAY